MHARACADSGAVSYPIAPSTAETASGALTDQGFALVRGATTGDVAAILGALGRIIHEFDVRPRRGTRALVTSKRNLPPHTDHHRAHWIAWRCVRPAAAGGESVVVDAREAFLALPSATRRVLHEVMLMEHDVFDDGVVQQPLVSTHGGVPRIYFSYWLCRDDLPTSHEVAIRAFRDAVEAAPHRRATLMRGDLLVLDNTRMLHGRTAFEDDDRWLHRFWLERSA